MHPITADLTTALDPVRIMEAAGFTPDAWQERVLRSEASRILLLCTRQAGKSTVTAALALAEAARVKDALFVAVSPMLATGGRLIGLSTPFGCRGWFHAEWTGGEDWERICIPASACSRISPAFLEKERRTLGPWSFAQEYDCQ